MVIEEFLSRLEAVRPLNGKWIARCPAHPDKSPSLSIREGEDGKIVCYDFGGCPNDKVVAAMGLTLADLFRDAASPRNRHTPKPYRIDRRHLAFSFDLHALALRTRAEATLAAASQMNTEAWSDKDRDAAMNAVGHAYDDTEWAAVLEDVADTQRFKALASLKGAAYAA